MQRWKECCNNMPLDVHACNAMWLITRKPSSVPRCAICGMRVVIYVSVGLASYVHHTYRAR